MDIANMTNKEAAAILRNILHNSPYPRSNGKSTIVTIHIMAFLKAIEVLENTPERKEN